MKQLLKKYFIPHEENNYHPHILHAKRAVLYGGLFVAMKIIVVAFALFLPLEVFVMPDVLADEQRQIISLVNIERAQKGFAPLAENDPLDRSADLKAADMARHEYFSHVGPNNRRLGTLLDMVGYKYQSAGENLAMGFSSAKDVVEAWIKSPTHYANMVDHEFEDTGVGLESGYFNGVPTVYVAQHFGWPYNQSTIVNSADVGSPKVKTVAVAPKKSIDQKEVAGVTIQTAKIAPTPVAYDKTNSKVYWEEKNGQIAVNVKATITGSIESATVSIGDTTIPLHQTNGVYVGGTVIHQTVDQFFKVIIAPVITIKSASGELITDSIDWNTVKIVSPTPFQKYVQAQSSLGFLTNLFAVSKDIYLSFILLFSLALLLAIFIEIKIQRPRMIIQTAGLLSLLLCLYIF